MAGDDLEELACSAYLLGDADGCRRVLQQAQRAYWEGGNRRRAARCLFWVGFTLLLEGELAQAGGWLARTRRLVEHGPAAVAAMRRSVTETADRLRQTKLLPAHVETMLAAGDVVRRFAPRTAPRECSIWLL